MQDPARLMRFVLEMRQAGVTDARALAALERTPRAHYAPAHLAGLALDDVALPLPFGQSMTKPSIVGRVISALSPQEGDVVLEIGTGSGFQAAAIATIAHRVVSLERIGELVVEARSHFGLARLMRVQAHLADGYLGWTEDGPYDRIVINCAAPEVPPALFDQLKPGGVLVAPIGGPEVQRLLRFHNGKGEDLGPIKLSSLEREIVGVERPVAHGFDSEGA